MRIIDLRTKECDKCPMKFKLFAPFELHGSPEIVFIGEAPGWEEVQNRPFIGKAGQVLRGAIDSLGLTDYAIINSVSCLPTDDGQSFRAPTDEELSYCPYAVRFVKVVNPKIVVLLGKTAIRKFLPEYADVSMRNLVGRVIEKDGIRYGISYHPSVVARGLYSKDRFISNLKSLLNRQPLPDVRWTYEVINSPDDFRRVLEDIQAQEIVLDYETSDKDVLMIGLGNTEHVWVLDVRSFDWDENSKKLFVDFLKSRDKSRDVLVYNTSFESRITYNLTGELIVFKDVWSLCKSLGYPQGLKENVRNLLNIEPWEDQVEYYAELLSTAKRELAKKRPNIEKVKEILRELELPETTIHSLPEKHEFELIPPTILAEYNAKDVYLTYMLYDHIRKTHPEMIDIWLRYYQPQETLACLMNTYMVAIEPEHLEDIQKTVDRYVGESLAEVVNMIADIVIRWMLNSPVSWYQEFGLFKGYKKRIPVRHLPTTDILDAMIFVIDYLKDAISSKSRTALERLVNLRGRTESVIIRQLITDEYIPDLFSEYLLNLFGVSSIEELAGNRRALKAFEETVQRWKKESINNWTANELATVLSAKVGINADNMSENFEMRYRCAMHLLYHTRVVQKALKIESAYLKGGKFGGSLIRARMPDPMKPPIPHPDGEKYFITPDFLANSTETKRWSAFYHTLPFESEIRELVTTRSDEHIFIHYDFSQNEIRVMAMLSGDENLIKALEGSDIHREIASIIWRKPPSEITDIERRFSKMATFSILYGKSVQSFAEDYMAGDYEQAQRFFEQFFSAFPRLKEWIEKMHREAWENNGKVRLIFGDYVDVNINQEGWHRRAQNYPVQSIASSLSALTTYEIYKRATAKGIPVIPLSFVHDGVEMEVHRDYLKEFIRLIYQTVDEYPRQFGVRLKADVEIGVRGYHLLEVKEITDEYIIAEGVSKYLDELLHRLRNLKYEILETGEKHYPKSEMLIARRPYSIYVGQTLPTVKVKIYI